MGESLIINATGNRGNSALDRTYVEKKCSRENVVKYL